MSRRTLAAALFALSLGACQGGNEHADASVIDALLPIPDAPAPAVDAAPDARVVADAGPDAGPGMPDIVLVEGEMTGSVQITDDFFNPQDCELIEKCVGAPGQRRLLRFDTVTANMGNADLTLGAVPPPGVSTDIFIWSECHQHHHVTGYADYQLLGPQGVVVSGHKQAFCLEDIEQQRAGAPSSGYSCSNQGISAGWADVYNGFLPCQWIDITDVPPGLYTLKISVNPSQQLLESNYNNNQLFIPVSL